MDAIVVGSANTDLIMHVDRLPAEGNTAVGGGFKSGPGGKGANQAACLARLGVNTTLIARFGNDGFSSLLREEIARLGVDLSSAVIDGERSGGIVFIILDKQGSNTMVADLGSNLFLDEDDITRASKLFTNSRLLLLQLEVSDSANNRAAEYAREHGLKIVLNPAPMRPFDTSILKGTDIITPNMQELEALLRNLKGKPMIGFEEKDPVKIAEAARELFAYGVREIVVTLGKRGSLLVKEDFSLLFGTYRVNQVDATAAGDSFTAALAFMYASSSDIAECISFASAAAAITITRAGAVYSLPTLREVNEFVRKNTLTTSEYFS